MTYRVPLMPAPINAATGASLANDVRIALPVREAHFRPWAANTNWLNGVGGALVGCGPVGPATAASATGDYPFYIWPSDEHTARVWCVGLVSTGYSSGVITVNPSEGGDAYNFAITDMWPEHDQDDLDGPILFNFLQDDNTSAEGGVSLRIAAGGNAVSIDSVCVFEVPLTALNTGTGDPGASLDSCRKGQPIFENTTIADKISAQGVWSQVETAKTRARRKKLFDWAAEEDNGVVITDSSFTGSSNIFTLDPAVQCRHLEDANTTRSVDWAVWAKTSGGALTGEVRVQSTSGGSDTISVSGSTGQWYTGTIDIETDDWSQGDLVRGGTRDLLTFEARKTSTTTNIEVCGLAVGEVD